MRFNVNGLDSKIRPAHETLSSLDKADKEAVTALMFLRLCNINNGVIERLGRYEVALWKQAAQMLLLLAAVRHRSSR